MTSKEKVLRAYRGMPFCGTIYNKDVPPVLVGYRIYQGGGRHDKRLRQVELGPKLSTVKATEEEAWDDAASKLSAPLSTEQSDEVDDNGFRDSDMESR